jgi:small subunit ribosomal protein S16
VKDVAVKIRLKRLGKKKAPFYRIVVADERSPRDGRNIDEIGTYDPNQEPAAVKVDEEAAKKWIANGAKPTDVVARLFKQAGIV